MTRYDGHDLIDKDWPNIFLDSAPCTIIWISNTLWFSHDSVRRRFSYSVRFGTLSAKARRLAWSSVLSASTGPELVSQHFIQDASRRFEVNRVNFTGEIVKSACNRNFRGLFALYLALP